MYNPQYTTEFIYDIFEHLKETEVDQLSIFIFIYNFNIKSIFQHINAPECNKMLKTQKEVNDPMRSLVIDWIIEVNMDTFFLFL